MSRVNLQKPWRDTAEDGTAYCGGISFATVTEWRELGVLHEFREKMDEGFVVKGECLFYSLHSFAQRLLT